MVKERTWHLCRSCVHLNSIRLANHQGLCLQSVHIRSFKHATQVVVVNLKSLAMTDATKQRLTKE